jgi:solute:Na+ symporter, SSS family
MVATAVLGSLPLFTGATILQATTISGTMVLGLAPAFILGVFLRAPAAAFHLAFWTGIAAGIIEVLGLVPAWMVMGDGRYGALLGVNVWGLGIATGLYLLVWAGAVVRDRLAAEASAGPDSEPEPVRVAARSIH